MDEVKNRNEHERNENIIKHKLVIFPQRYIFKAIGSAQGNRFQFSPNVNLGV
jgi:hypothetical protein